MHLRSILCFMAKNEYIAKKDNLHTVIIPKKGQIWIK